MTLSDYIAVAYLVGVLIHAAVLASFTAWLLFREYVQRRD